MAETKTVEAQTAEAKTAEEQDEEVVILKEIKKVVDVHVVDQNGKKLIIKTPNTKRFGCIRHHYAEYFGLPRESIWFEYEGRKIMDRDTPVKHARKMRDQGFPAK